MKNAAAKKENITASLHFPDERACVDILEILRDYTPASKKLILATVEANMASYPQVTMTGCNDAAWKKLKTISIKREPVR